jgi:GTPase SAR1 family protein
VPELTFLSFLNTTATYILFASVYDITNRESFLNIGKTWLEEVELYSNVKNAVKCLVGNKLDQEDRRAVTAQVRLTSFYPRMSLCELLIDICYSSMLFSITGSTRIR